MKLITQQSEFQNGRPSRTGRRDIRPASKFWAAFGSSKLSWHRKFESAPPLSLTGWRLSAQNREIHAFAALGRDQSAPEKVDYLRVPSLCWLFLSDRKLGGPLLGRPKPHPPLSRRRAGCRLFARPLVEAGCRAGRPSARSPWRTLSSSARTSRPWTSSVGGWPTATAPNHQTAAASPNSAPRPSGYRHTPFHLSLRRIFSTITAEEAKQIYTLLCLSILAFFSLRD
jgi:hypothetical protein